MDEPNQLEPLLVRVLSSDPLRGLEGVHDVRKISVGVALIHQLIEHLEGLHHGGLEVVELEPLLVLRPDKLDGLVGVHLCVGPLDPLPDLILLVVITKCLLVFKSLLRSQELGCVKKARVVIMLKKIVKSILQKQTTRYIER